MGSSPIATGVTKPLTFDLLANVENEAKQQLSLAQKAFIEYASKVSLGFKDFEKSNGYVANCELNGVKKRIRFQHQKKNENDNQYRFNNLNPGEYIVVLRTDPEGKIEGNMCEITENNIKDYNNRTKQFDGFIKSEVK